jgi:formate/nitrite transporter FocA (FNT family)
MSPFRSERGDRRVRPGFRDRELEEIESKSAVRPTVVFEVIRREGEAEMRRPVSALLLSGLVAGVAIGFSLLAEALLRKSLPDAPWRPLIENLGYTVGFLIVILGQMQLFTENTITPVASLLIRRSWAMAAGLAKIWVVVLAANLIGATLFAAFARWSGAFGADALSAMIAISEDATAHGFLGTLIRGVPAGWLIAALVWIGPTADSGRALIIVSLTYLIALADLTHVVAGAAEAALLVFDGRMGAEIALWRFVAPAVIGNVIGGSALFTLLVWGQIRAELPGVEE